DSHNEAWLQTVKPLISIDGRRSLPGPEASPRAIPWDVVHRRMPLVDRPHVRLMPDATGLRDVGMKDRDRWVFGVVVEFHSDLIAVVKLEIDQIQVRLYQRPSAPSARSWPCRRCVDALIPCPEH